MNRQAAQKIADAVLYEGYMLYPYRASALKNRQRWSFGTLYPPAYEEVGRGTESNRMHSECLVAGNETTKVHVQLRFLHLISRRHSGGASSECVTSLTTEARDVEISEESAAREFDCDYTDLTGAPLLLPFSFPAQMNTKASQHEHGNGMEGSVHSQQQIDGTVSCSSERLADGVVKLTCEITNGTALPTDPADRNETLLRSMLSAHLILTVEGGEFISLLEPSKELSEFAKGCKNLGNFPVLLGERGSRDMLLCSPILLYDYPQIAPESAGDFFDGTEMDEMLTLRVMTLTDEERNEVRSGDERVRALLQRTEETAREQLMKTHGTIRSMHPPGEER